MTVLAVKHISEMRGYFRLDAEFWQPQYESNDEAVTKHDITTLGDASRSVRKGIFYILADEYTEEGIPFYRSSNVGDILLDDDAEVVHISKERHTNDSKTALTRGDLILAKTGKVGASVVSAAECNISQDVVGIRLRESKIHPYYVAVFLNTTPGRLQLQRWFQGQVQMHLSLPDAKRIQIPIPARTIQSTIQRLVESAMDYRQQAEQLYQQAEADLLDDLGLESDKSTPPLFCTFSSAAAFEVERLDAE